ncbi:MAG TPA: hypothetical protein VHS13_05155, partial [Edaphobacter sp.]|nr:hypothetical protein [Edaphobacter sp.]
SVVDQVVGPPKTLASRRPIPMSSELAFALANWRKQTSYSKPGDWYSPALKHSGGNLTGRMQC